jgi:hypothetical protein
LLTVSRDEEERARLESEFRYNLDRQCELEDARRAGERIGSENALQETARKLKAMGLGADLIAQATGL